MNEVEFRNWLINKGVKTKVAGDTISRLKRIEREIETAILMNNTAHRDRSWTRSDFLFLFL